MDRLSWHDLNRCFFLGCTTPVWKVVELMDDTETCLCNMVGTDDCAVLPQGAVARMLEEYDLYWDEVRRYGP